MRNDYETSKRKPNLKRHSRFVVTFQADDELVRTYGVWASIESEATMRVITYIREEGHDLMFFGHYFLTPRISKDKADFEIN